MLSHCPRGVNLIINPSSSFPLQFHRVLSELEMGGLVNALEFGILYRKFDVKVGGRNDVNYIAFCEMIDDYAQTKWTDPTLK